MLRLPSYRNSRNDSWTIVLAAIASFAVAHAARAQRDREADPIDFGLQIRPILSEHCFHCHGPDPAHREADLRLDDETSAKGAGGPSDRPAAIVAGSLESSELWQRIQSDDPDRVMPPPSARKTLTPEQKSLIGRWLKQGAPWGAHWSLAPLAERPVPDSPSYAFVRTPIDAWALHGMRRHGLTPAPPADASTLIRRMSLDLIGLPPSAARVQRFVQDFKADRDRAVRDLADELLASPSYGEHWARLWLDLARYADTKGYEKDLKRDMWPYRDWVIDALNADMPYDRFSQLQLAGDLEPGAALEDRIATAFHRATLSNDEGGTDDEEYRVAAVKDRVDTSLQVWMGLTAGCAKCHSHKYDPISMEDYYRVYAIWNQTEDADRYDDEPRISLPSPEQQKEIAELEERLQVSRTALAEARRMAATSIAAQWTVAKPQAAWSTSGIALILQSDATVRALADRPERDTYSIDWVLPPGEYRALKLEALRAASHPGAPEQLGLNAADPNFVLSELHVDRLASTDPSPAATRLELDSPKASFEQNGWPVAAALDGNDSTGWAISPKQSEEHWAIVSLREPLILTEPTTLRVRLSQQYGNRLLLQRLRLSAIGQVSGPLTPDDVPEVQKVAEQVREIENQVRAVRESVPKLPILKELAEAQRRATKLHQRGSFLDPGPEVSPALPPLFPSAMSSHPSPTRKEFAQWLFEPNNPLTSRVMANRVWAQLFGRGLVETEEDFGSQGSMPTHPELLDVLARDFQHTHRWSIKSLLRSIVLSNTYQQAYAFDALRAERDPRNDWLSRGARFRLSAEVIRDQALAVSGLLSDRRGGPPVMPPQPDGLWRSTYSGARWVTSQGPDRYRRGLYTFWKRTTPYPSMETFDATTREVCQIRRISTNTPLQALVTLNDPVYTEASIAMARLWLRAASSDVARIQWGYWNTLGRSSRSTEEEKLLALLERSRAHFSVHPEAAKELLSAFPTLGSGSESDIEVAAWSMVTSAMLNLDELLMRP